MTSLNDLNALDYDAMIQRALRGVVREALRQIAEKGLPGDHHFYLTFRTNRPDVEVPDYLRERHPTEITIVLQHQFWDLEVTDTQFKVTLSFNNRQERLTVPFSAIVSFMDPSVKFGLQFVVDEDLALLTSDNLLPPSPPDDTPQPKPKKPGEGNVVALDAFRKKKS